MKKEICKLLSFVCTCALLTGCTESPNPAQTPPSAKNPGESTEPVTCIYVVPGEAPDALEEGLKAINDKLAADGVGVKVELRYIPWDSWDQKINFMLSTGEKFDLFQVMNDRVTLAHYVAGGVLADISTEIELYGENIRKVNPENIMKSGQIKGVQYGIPAYWMESAIDPELFIRRDLMEKYGITKVPSTWEELTSALETVIQNWEGDQKPYVMLTGSNNSQFSYPYKTYEEWPFVVYDRIFYVDQEGNVKNFFETDAFRKDCEYARSWYERGIIDPDCMTVTSAQVENQMMTGNFFLGAPSNIESIRQYYPDITVADLIRIDFAPKKPDVRPFGTRNMNAVPVSSQHPEAAVKLVNWIYASQENYDLFLYGREGIDYVKTQPHGRKELLDSQTLKPGYSFADWMMGNINYLRPSESGPTAYNQRLYTTNENAVDGYAAQFTFDASPVQAEYNEVMAVIFEYINPMVCGVKTYEANIDEVLKLLKEAGADRLVEEFRRQLAESKQQSGME